MDKSKSVRLISWLATEIERQLEISKMNKDYGNNQINIIIPNDLASDIVEATNDLVGDQLKGGK